MTKTNRDLSELLAKHDRGILPGISQVVPQLIMETHVEALIGAGRHERSPVRTTWRNGHPHLVICATASRLISSSKLLPVIIRPFLELAKNAATMLGAI